MTELRRDGWFAGRLLCWLAVLVLGSVGAVGCGGGAAATAQVAAVAVEPGGAECAVCGMVVREQPSPRGQVLHRDGSHQHFCSIGDMRAYLQTPGPLGAPVASFVEVMPAGTNLYERDPAPRPWVAAEDASYVVDFRRIGVMGLPVGSFATPADAAAAAPGVQGRVTTWEALRATPFNAVPE